MVVTVASQAFMPGKAPPHHTCPARTRTGTFPSLPTLKSWAGNSDAISTSYLFYWMLKAQKSIRWLPSGRKL